MTRGHQRAQYQNHGHECSAVNHAPIENVSPKRIQNRVYRQCAKDGFNARLKAELNQELKQELNKEPNQDQNRGTANNLSLANNIPLYSHHSTRQSYFNLGWQAVTTAHLIRAKARAQNQVSVNKAVK
jgi:hypothetical protein